MDRLPLCVIGGGSIGRRHIGCAVASDRVALTAVVEADPATARTLQGQGLHVVASLDTVPGTTRAAVIATPTPNHDAMARACLDRGWAVLVEKPLTQSHAEAVALCDHAAALGLPLLTGHHRRCHPFVAAARRALPLIGDLVALQGIWCLRKHDTYYDADWRRQAGAGPILTNLSHEVDLLQLLAGPIVAVTALAANAARGFAIEDTTALALRFASGALGSFVLSDAGASPWAFEAATGENPEIAVRGDDPLRMIGTTGALGFPSLDLWGAAAGKPPDWRFPLIRTKARDLPRVDPIAVQLDRFAAILGGASDDLLATGREGARTIAVLDAVLRAVETGQAQEVQT